eukprot:6431798-Alexandrium_andersonii.AAC.1
MDRFLDAPHGLARAGQRRPLSSRCNSRTGEGANGGADQAGGPRSKVTTPEVEHLSLIHISEPTRLALI